MTFIVGAVLAAIPSFVIWCFSGLENSLYALVVTSLGAILFRATVDDRLLTAKVALLGGGLSALAALTRPDGLIYAAAYPLVVLIEIRPPTVRAGIRSIGIAVGIFAVIFGAYVLWRHFEFGRWTSLPAVAKRQAAPDTGTLARAGELIQYIGAIAGVVLAILIGITMVRPSKLRSGMISFLVPLVLAVVAYSVLAPDWMGQLRFASPVWPLVVIVGVFAGEAAFRHFGVRGRIVLAVALVVAALPAWNLFSGYSNGFRAAPTVPMCGIATRPSEVDNAYADILGVRGGSLLAPDVGATAMTSRLHVIDLAGLADSTMADFWANQRWTDLDNYVFDVAKPTFVELHPPWSVVTGVAGDPRLARDYVRLRQEPGQPDITDWVRRDAVPSQGKLDQARTFGATKASLAMARVGAAPRSQCGATLRPGQWPS
jgi:hypothetical protein